MIPLCLWVHTRKQFCGSEHILVASCNLPQHTPTPSIAENTASLLLKAHGVHPMVTGNYSIICKSTDWKLIWALEYTRKKDQVSFRREDRNLSCRPLTGTPYENSSPSTSLKMPCATGMTSMMAVMLPDVYTCLSHVKTELLYAKHLPHTGHMAFKPSTFVHLHSVYLR